MTHQPLEVGDGERSTAQVKLLDALLWVEVTTDQVNFMFQTLQVLLDSAVLAGGIGKGAKGWFEARRQAHIQGKRPALLATDAQGTKQVQRADAVVKLLRVGMTVGVEYALIAPSDKLAGVVKEIEHDKSPRLAAVLQCPGSAIIAP
jgi:hypothetical protein